MCEREFGRNNFRELQKKVRNQLQQQQQQQQQPSIELKKFTLVGHVEGSSELTNFSFPDQASRVETSRIKSRDICKVIYTARQANKHFMN